MLYRRPSYLEGGNICGLLCLISNWMIIGILPYFLEFVDGVLRQHDSSDITRLILIMRCKIVSSFRFRSWISTAMTHNIQHLELTMPGCTIPSLPCSLFTCQSLRSLCLNFHGSLQTPTSIHLSHLKTLSLWYVEFVDDKSAESLFSGCPVLEELKLWDCEWKNIKNIKISIPTLKKLKIYHFLVRENRPRSVINIYVPNLISLDYHTVWGFDFYLYDLCSLVDASIQGIDHENPCRLLNVIASAYNVKSLAIGETSLKALSKVEEVADRLPTFHNLTNFTLSSRFNGWTASCRPLMDFLEKTPNLKCINFYGGFKSRFKSVPPCVENSLEKVVISSIIGQQQQLYIMRYFLRNAKKLEKITLHVGDPSYKKKLDQKLKRPHEGPGKCLIDVALKAIRTRY